MKKDSEQPNWNSWYDDLLKNLPIEANNTWIVGLDLL